MKFKSPATDEVVDVIGDDDMLLHPSAEPCDEARSDEATAEVLDVIQDNPGSMLVSIAVERAMVKALDVDNTSSPNRQDEPSIPKGRRSFGPLRIGTWNPGEWAEEHWDIIAIGAAFVVSVALGVALCVVYNVTATWMRPGMMPTPPSIESRPGPLPDAAPDERPLYGRTGPSR